MSNVIILMAGGGEAFSNAGYIYPKNLTEIQGIPLVEHVINGTQSLPERLRKKMVCILSRDEDMRFHTSDVIRLLQSDCAIVTANDKTGGAACTGLLAIEHIDLQAPLILLNGDIVIDDDLSRIMACFEERGLDAGAIVFKGVHPRWSFLRLDEDGLVIEAAEKRPISNLATTGLFYFRKGAFFVDCVSSMLRKDAHVEGVFYICPALNEMVLSGLKVGVHVIDKAHYHTLKTPSDVLDYERFLQRQLWNENERER